eukprot:symbB.v1.2.002571.t2/scaffold137.1/size303853/2
MVDYSKWDKLTKDLSDDEDTPARPHVTKFDTAQQVTIGQGASGQADVEMEEEDDEPFETEDEVAEGDRREDVLQCRALGERALRNGDVSEGIRLLEKAIRLGGCPGLEDTLRAARKTAEQTQTASAKATPTPARAQETQEKEQNGGLVPEKYAWSQTKETVELNLFVQEDAKAKDVEVEITETTLKISVQRVVLLSGDWEFKVEPEEDPDWELTSREGRRVLRLLVRKAPFPGGMSVSVWWSRILKGEPVIDVKDLEGRKRGREKSEEFKKAWTDAHAMFKEAVKNRTPIPIDVPGE